MQYFLPINLKTNWRIFIKNLFKEKWFIDLDKTLFFLAKEKNIFPPKEKIFTCFDFFNIERTRVVLFGQDPYFKQDLANGLAFSVDEGIKIPPTLRNIFLELENDLKIKRTSTNLNDWAKQGILLLNTSLTVSENLANSHQNIGWELFIKKVIFLLNKQDKIIFVLLGNNAKKLKPLIDHKKHIIIETSHPSPLSFNKGFNGSKIFSKINSNLIDKIKW